MVDTIRAATLADSDAIAALHSASWRSSYRGILSDATLGPGLDEERRRHWRAKLESADPDDLVLMVEGLAFITVWAKGDLGFGAYIDNLHVHPERRGGGIGRRLLQEAARRLGLRGERRAYLWVFDANVRTVELYLRLGGEIVERGLDEIDGVKVPHSRVVWRDIASLISSR
jgi:ribosomal protein S18 acetylase RimI-like enzyme